MISGLCMCVCKWVIVCVCVCVCVCVSEFPVTYYATTIPRHSEQKCLHECVSCGGGRSDVVEITLRIILSLFLFSYPDQPKTTVNNLGDSSFSLSAVHEVG